MRIESWTFPLNIFSRIYTALSARCASDLAMKILLEQGFYEPRYKMILCCKCGIPIEPRLMNMCDRCLTTEVTVSSKVKRSLGVEHCRGCGRYLCPPKNWVEFTWGSKEFLLFLIKKNKTLGGLSIVDSNFAYTEPNSKRIIILLTVCVDGVEQPLEIRYVVKNMQCPDCAKVEAKQFWNSLVQVRHRAEHKRMFIYLEQLILKHNAYGDTTNIKPRKGGLDFYYLEKHGAIKMVNFLQGVLPVRLKVSERLISKDVHTSKCNYKFSYSVEIVPLCKDDLVVVDKQLAASLGAGTLVLVQKMATNIVLLDPRSMKTTRITSAFYWNNQERFKVLMSSKDFVRYTVVVKEQTRIRSGEYSACDLTVTADGNEFIEARSYLGNSVEEEDTVLGYDLQHSNLAAECGEKPDIILVRKSPRDDIIWKIKTTEDNSSEYRLFVEDVRCDKEMMQNIGVIDEKDEINKELERLMVN